MASIPPKRRTRSSAVFSPIPGTPGMLSEASPIRAFKSTISGGAKPYSSSNRAVSYSAVSSRPIRDFTKRTAVPPPMSWKLSRSPVTISQLQPAAAHCFAAVPSMSSASQPGASSRRMPISSSISLSMGIWTARSSGMGLRWALYPAYCLCRNVGSGRSKATQSASGALSSSRRCKIAAKP